MKVLVVDDHAYNRDLLSFILEDMEHECVFAENGEQAFQLVNDHPDIGLVLMDVMMPVVDGIEATRMIKDAHPERFLPVVFVTALDDAETLTRCLDCGGDDFIPKPVNESVLIAKVRAHERAKNLYDTVHQTNEKLLFHQKMVEREHSIVEHIFDNRSKNVGSVCDNVEIYTSPMSMFNGDLATVAPSPSGGLYALVGDFTGHGLASSIATLPVTELFHQSASRQASVAQMAVEINRRLVDLLPENMFFCAAIMELDRQGENLTLWLGGMNDVLIIEENSTQPRRIEAAHMPLGILNDGEFDDSPSLINLNPSDRIYIYTDGIIEAENKQSGEFGQDRLENILFQSKSHTVDAVIDAVHEYQSDEQSDDITMIEVKAGPVVHRHKSSGELFDAGEEYHRAESIPWLLDMQLQGADLKNTNVVNQVMSFVSSIQGIELHQDKIFMIVSELYSNSLEHGVLGLDSNLKQDADGFEKYYQLREQRLEKVEGHFIKIRFEYRRGEPNILLLNFLDSGEGFDYEALNEKLNQEDDAHGRGVSLLRSLCSYVQYSDEGRSVTACYELREH
jgi:CheY-like chemotaxis protein/anti-sigma regulatory factor (Ser/Thr protein kinase)